MISWSYYGERCSVLAVWRRLVNLLQSPVPPVRVSWLGRHLHQRARFRRLDDPGHGAAESCRSPICCTTKYARRLGLTGIATKRGNFSRSGEDPGYASASRNARTRRSGSVVARRSPIIATAEAPASITAGAVSSVMPPMATTGTPRDRPTASDTRANPTGSYPVALVLVPNTGPMAM